MINIKGGGKKPMNKMDKILYRMWLRAIKAAVARKDWRNAKIYKRELLRITKRYE